MTVPEWRVHVVGAGLVGMSLALALQDACVVTIEDSDAGRATQANRSLSNARREAQETDSQPLIVVVAVPPVEVDQVIVAASNRYVHATIMDTCSVMARPQPQLETSKGIGDRYVGSHPLAGRATAGPTDASGDLFRGRTWALVAGSAGNRHRERATWLVEATGARPIWVGAAAHDEAVALTSHTPQLLASALAGLLETRTGPQARALAVELSGPGLLDMTRLAGSPTALWTQIVAANRTPIVAALRPLAAQLAELAEVLDDPGGDWAGQVAQLLERGRRGRRLLEAKHPGLSVQPGRHVPARAAPPSAQGAPVRSSLGRAAAESGWTWVEISIDDEPGALATVFATAAAAGVNVEDLRIDHAPYAQSGTLGLAVPPHQASRLRSALAASPAACVRAPAATGTAPAGRASGSQGAGASSEDR